MKPEAQKLIEGYIKILQEKITDQDTYEHVIASVLEIYTEPLCYTEALNNIIKDVEGIKENEEVFNALILLAQSLVGYNREIKAIYTDEIIQDYDEWESTITGEIYDFIYKH